jgi:hypothetical protein
LKHVVSGDGKENQQKKKFGASFHGFPDLLSFKSKSPEEADGLVLILQLLLESGWEPVSTSPDPCSGGMREKL